MEFKKKFFITILTIILSISITLYLFLFTPLRESLTGPQGIQGEQGSPGPKGDQGPIGPQGIQGEQGPPGNLIIFTDGIQNKTVTINGFIENGEWPCFIKSVLKFHVTFDEGIRNNELAWDKNDKEFFFSYFIKEETIFISLIICDDYLCEDYQIDCLYLYINGESATTYCWTMSDPYRSNSWATYGAEGEYSHTGNGEFGAYGLYIIELKYPLKTEVTKIAFKYAEVTKYTDAGFFKISTYWDSESYEVKK